MHCARKLWHCGARFGPVTSVELPLLSFAAMLWVCLASPAAATIRYRVSFSQPDQHLFHVTMTVPAEGPSLVVALPAWNALYQVHDFTYRLRDLHAAEAASNSVELQMDPLDKETWRISTPAEAKSLHGDIEVDYAIQWDDAGPFNSQLDDHHAFINLAEILLYVPDRRAEDTLVQFVDLPSGWRTAAQLATAQADNTYAAHSYDALVDAPVEAGEFDQFDFADGGVNFRVVVDSNSWSKPRLEDELRRVTTYELQLMGGPPPFDPPSGGYTFFFHIGPYADEGGGGMEHRNSTAIAATSVDAAGAIAAHEFFHSWNVKRIRPQSLEPVDYTKEQYTRALWFAEGVTSTYASYTLERTGLWSKDHFYADLASQIDTLQSRPARKWQSVEESSIDAWLEKYDAYDSPDRSISYYNKGQILGVMLDLAIRDATDNRKSLDDVLRRMNQEYARAGKFYDDSNGIRAVVEELSGKSFADFFRRYVSGTDEIPYNDFLSFAGLELKTNSVASDAPNSTISEIAHSTERQRRIREGLLHGTTDSAASAASAR